MKEVKYSYMPAAKHCVYSKNDNSKSKTTSLRNMPAPKKMILLSSPLLTS